MATASGWEVLLLTVEVTDARCQVRLGVGFVLWSALVVSRLLHRHGDADDRPKATG